VVVVRRNTFIVSSSCTDSYNDIRIILLFCYWCFIGSICLPWLRFNVVSCRHVARLRRLGGDKNFRGAIVTGHRTHLTITITDSATTMKMGLQNNAASEVSIKILGIVILYIPNCDILGMH